MRERIVPLLPYGRADNVLFRAGVGLRETGALGVGELATEIDGLDTAVFPSHFFEYPASEAALRLVRERGLEAVIQVSSGPELMQFLPEAKRAAALAAAIEIVSDREFALEEIEELRRSGARIRLLHCPVRTHSVARALERLPAHLREGVNFYFARKRRYDDEFLGADEIYLLLRELRARFPGFRPVMAPHLHTAEEAGREPWPIRRYRAEPTEANYRASLGQRGRARRLLFGVAGRWGGPFALYPAVVVLWLVKSPRELAAFLAPPFRSSVDAVAWRARVAAIRVAFALRSPAWTIRRCFPPAYWLLIHPVKKAYWFTRYQIDRRILRRPT